MDKEYNLLQKMTEKNKNALVLALVFAVALLIFFLYSPSFEHAPHSDQIDYYAEVSARQSWVSLAIQSYDLNRDRVLSWGDQILFRPVVYFILGTEKYFFGYHFRAWQITGVLLHLWVSWCLFNLLYRIRPGVFSSLLAIFFATLFINMEMVVWQNISAYMIFWGLVLIILEQSYVCSYQQWQSWRLWLMTGLLFIAVFTYEIGAVFALLLVLFLWVSCKRKQVFVLLLPVLFYSLINYWNMAINHIQPVKGPGVLNISGLVDFLGKIQLAVQEWFFSGMFPSYIDMMYRGVYKMASFGYYVYRPQVGSFKPLNLADPLVVECLVLGVLYFGNLIQGGIKNLWKKQGAFLFLLTLMALAYTALIVYGRSSTQEDFSYVLRNNLYYSYGFWALLVTFIGVSLDIRHRGYYRHNNIFRIVAMAIIGILICVDSLLLHRGLKEQARRDKETIVLCSALNRFIREHQGEKDFSFYVAPDCPGNYYYAGLRNPDDPLKKYSFVEGIYLPYFKTTGAKYWFSSTANPGE
jgi:hypothetical protein